MTLKEYYYVSPTRVCMGTRLTDASNRTYILAQVSSYQMALINLSDGNRWRSPVIVKDIHNPTREEMERIASSDLADWTID